MNCFTLCTLAIIAAAKPLPITGAFGIQLDVPFPDTVTVIESGHQTSIIEAPESDPNFKRYGLTHAENKRVRIISASTRIADRTEAAGVFLDTIRAIEKKYHVEGRLNTIDDDNLFYAFENNDVFLSIMYAWETDAYSIRFILRSKKKWTPESEPKNE